MNFLKLNLLWTCVFYGFGLFLCLLASGSAVFASDEKQQETHTGIYVKKNLGDGLDAFIDGHVKSIGFFEQAYSRKLELGGKLDLSKRISLRGSLKGIDILGSTGWNRYYVPGVGATIEWTPSRLEVDFRNLLEFWDLIGDGATRLRVRQRIRLSSPMTIGDLRIKPYISEEYLSAINSNDQFVWNRVSAGNSLYLGDRIRLDSYYIWQRKKDPPEWENAHAAGAKIRFYF